MHRAPPFIIGAFVSVLMVAGLAVPVDAALPLKRKSCGAVVTRSFRLINNLTCTGDGLKVGKAGITIDLNGKTLTGDEGDRDFGIDNTAGHDDVTVKNGTVRLFDDGVKVGAAAARNTIKNVTATDHITNGIDVDGGKRHKIVDNDTSRNGNNGIDLVGRFALVSRNRVVANEDGILIDGNDNTVKMNKSDLNFLAGIFIFGHRNGVGGNFVRENDLQGIRVAGNENVVEGTFACGNDAPLQIDVSGTDNVYRNNFVQAECDP